MFIALFKYLHCFVIQLFFAFLTCIKILPRHPFRLFPPSFTHKHPLSAPLRYPYGLSTPKGSLLASLFYEPCPRGPLAISGAAAAAARPVTPLPPPRVSLSVTSPVGLSRGHVTDDGPHRSCERVSSARPRDCRVINYNEGGLGAPTLT